jgi:hypothetical protein
MHGCGGCYHRVIATNGFARLAEDSRQVCKIKEVIGCGGAGGRMEGKTTASAAAIMQMGEEALLRMIC